MTITTTVHARNMPVKLGVYAQEETNTLVMDLTVGELRREAHRLVLFLSTDHETRRLLREQFQTMLDHPLLAPLAVAEDGGKTDE